MENTDNVGDNDLNSSNDSIRTGSDIGHIYFTTTDNYDDIDVESRVSEITEYENA